MHEAITYLREIVQEKIPQPAQGIILPRLNQQLEDQIAGSVQMALEGDVVRLGDLYFSQKKYHVGGPDTRINGRIGNDNARAILYLLSRYGQFVPTTQIRRAIGSTSLQMQAPRMQLRSSGSFHIEVDDANREKKYSLQLR